MCAQLCDAVFAEVKNGARVVDVFELSGRTSLEIIGQGGLGYSFDPLSRVVRNSFAAAVKALMWVLLIKSNASTYLTPHIDQLQLSSEFYAC